MNNDLISRSALGEDLRESYKLLRDILNGLHYDDERRICEGQLGTFMEVMMRVKDFPTVDAVEVVHGEWIGHEGYEECNLCHHKFRFKYNYCPNCGAKMDGERKGDDAID